MMLQRYSRIRINKNSIKYREDSKIIKLDLRSLVIIFLISLIPVLLITFRSATTGADTHSYMLHFQLGESYMRRVANTDHEYFFWWIYIFFVKLGSIRLAFFTFAILSVYVALIAIYKLSLKYDAFIIAFLYLLLFYQDSFNIIRQEIAISFILLSMSYIFENNLKAFVVFVLIATMFHTSAIVCLPMYYFYNRIGNYRTSLYKYRNWVFLFVGVWLYIYLPDIKDFVENVLNISRFSDFGNIRENGVDIIKTIKSLIVTTLVPYTILFFVHSRKRRQWKYKDKKELTFLWATVIVFIITLVLRVYSNWMFRIGLYYELGTLLLVSKLCPMRYNYSYGGRKILVTQSQIMIVGYYIAYFLFLQYHTNFDSSALVNFGLSL